MQTASAQEGLWASWRDEIVGVDKLVPVLGGGYRRYVNLDNAASTPALRCVRDKVDEFLEWYSSVHRGAGYKSQVSTLAYEQARETVAGFVGADPRSRTVVFVRNTTEAINRLARRFSTGDGIVLGTVMEHHSNMLPWRAIGPVEYVEVTADGALDLDHLEAQLRRLAGRTRLVAVSGASNVTGHVNDLPRIARLAHASGVPVLVDAAQLAPHRAIDVRRPDDAEAIDFLALSGHKLYAPYGTGVLVGPRRFFEHGAPDFVGGGAVDMVSLDDVLWSDPPEKEEAGSPNVVGAVALAVAVSWLRETGMGNVAAHEARLTAYALRRLRAIPSLRIYGSADPARVDHRLGVITFNLGDMPHSLVAAVLSWEYAVAVRHGCFCAHPYLLRLLGVGEEEAQAVRARLRRRDRSAIPGAVRASFGLYNGEDDVDALVDALEEIARGGYRGRYVLDPQTGDYQPADAVSDLTCSFHITK